MHSISEHISKIITSENYSDPFSNTFDKKKLSSEIIKSNNIIDKNQLKFLIFCNELVEDLRSEIFYIFSLLNLKKKELRETLFVAANIHFLHTSVQIFDQMSGNVSWEVEKSLFAKLNQNSQQQVNSQFASEISADILSILLNLVQNWDPNNNDTLSKYKQLVSIDDTDIVPLLFLKANYLYNLKCSFNIIRYEDGIAYFLEDKFKIKSGIDDVLALNKVGEIRQHSILNQYFFNLQSMKSQFPESRIGIVDFLVVDNSLQPICGSKVDKLGLNGISCLYAFHPHLLKEKLKQFDNLTLIDLVLLLACVVECVNLFSANYLKDRKQDVHLNTPIKINKKELIKYLIKVTKHRKETINKFLSSICSVESEYHQDIWRNPLRENKRHFYFSMAALAAPNYNLFIDKWINESGFKKGEIACKFLDFVVGELKESNNSYYFKTIKDIPSLNMVESESQNTFFIEFLDIILMIDTFLFNYPIEDNETSAVLKNLTTVCIKAKKKLDNIRNHSNNSKKIFSLVLTNYTYFSGLKINNIPVVDRSLLNNYIISGELRRVAIAYYDNAPNTSNENIFRYYQTEKQFNDNLMPFFWDPVPVQNVLNRLYRKEIPIVKLSDSISVNVDTIDHITDDQLMSNKLCGLGDLLGYEYYSEPEDENVRNILDQNIIFSLGEIFSQLSISPYDAFSSRTELYYKVSKTKMLGFVHMAFFILKSLENLNHKKIVKKSRFVSVKYEWKEISNLFQKLKIFENNQIQLSKFKIDYGTLTTQEEKKLISFAIDVLNQIPQFDADEDILNSHYIPLAILKGFSSKYNVDAEFYSSCNNIITGLNFVHKYQQARDFAEEILLLSLNSRKFNHGWNALFRCYSQQKNTFEASINGCLFFSSFSVMTEVDEYFIVDTLYGSLLFFRNFGFNEFAKQAYDNLKNFKLSKYDEQRITISYFNSFLYGEIETDHTAQNEIIYYVKNNLDEILAFGTKGTGPWLALFYNIKRLKQLNDIEVKSDIFRFIEIFEKQTDKNVLVSLKNKILGSDENPKSTFIRAILNAYETRSVLDFVHEARNITLCTSHLLQSALKNDDNDGVLLCGLILNDQSLNYHEKLGHNTSTKSVTHNVNSGLLKNLNNYKEYLLSIVHIKPTQLLIWLFEDYGNVYCLTINNLKKIKVYSLNKWQKKKSDNFIKDLGSFYFDARKDSSGETISKFNNPRGEVDYNDIVQQEDYENLQKELHYTNLPIEQKFDEVLYCASIEMSKFPHNLINIYGDFIASLKPICNIISIERYADQQENIHIQQPVSYSAWIPSDDSEITINMGHNILLPILSELGCKIFKTTYPDYQIETDINIFLAHGVTDSFGFKAVYTNHNEKKGIVHPYHVFGKGVIAVLFICNSGLNQNIPYSNNVVSFSSELLNSGYSTVIAPFWSFDVSMCGIWLEEFLNKFKCGHSVNFSVFYANNKLKQYNKDSFKCYKAPSGSLAMHIYGNPNVYISSN